jgi:hypothetical protein
MEKRKWRWIPPTPVDDKLTQSQYRLPLNNQEGSGLRWVLPALPSSKRQQTDGSSLSTPSSETTFPRDEEWGDLMSHDRFLLCRRLSKNKGADAYHQSGDAYNLSSTTEKKTWPAHTRKTLNYEAGYCDNCQSCASANSNSPYMNGWQSIQE